ncbi:MAG TPA: hypothetical protein VD835_17600 [Pyrinomonadaceae bacterium]|nr:hypothetical protein [Pyrinomonadaceae bacterium]
MIVNAPIKDDIWQEHFTQLHGIALGSLTLSQKLAACAGYLQQRLGTESNPHLRQQMKTGASALERAAGGDFGGISDQFRNIVRTPAEHAEDEHYLVLVVKHINPCEPPYPLIIHAKLDRRTLEAQQVLRSPDFVGQLARRLRVESYSPASLASRVQGVNVLHHAGFVRYAVFADLVHEMEWTNSDVEGGLLFSNVADQFMTEDMAVVRKLFPHDARRLGQSGVLNDTTLRYLFSIFLVLHDTLGHTAPHSVHHWVKKLVGNFLLDPFEELGADTQFFWMATSEKMRGYLSQILTAEEAEALPVLWLLKRICHYIRRGFLLDAQHGNLMEDADARIGVLLWQYFTTHGAIVREDNHFYLNHALFPATIEKLLDDWLEVEGEVPGGVESYAGAICEFDARYRSVDPSTGKWEIPADLRHVFHLLT